MKKILLTTFLLSGLLVTAACGNNNTKEAEKTAETTETTEKETVVEKEEVVEEIPTIVGVAAGNENFTTLVAAVKAAELVETLNGDGPFTVFAPVNEAFDKLPEGTVEGLLKPESKETLTAILTYHVVAGKVMAADVVKAIKEGDGSFTITTVQGATLTASLDGENVILTDAKGGTSTIIMTDVAASNGVIHAIDTVVMP
ncbi:fasciclin domain-containing protein [Aquimarina brevivitae]|uniref:Putative surface protein with fasciclin (FAS1) repeats n=1 Tax=Aquimarina brevivitae TaxID=323412 RepID=A0A4V2F5S2_9FLAO|nr:fasciclin domain-containing protein [Aquimarina brevivitae]RZS93809.1 putative surface protein with fasciclin (FAS1) repeats [Aquimarina brevivitae]